MTTAMEHHFHNQQRPPLTEADWRGRIVARLLPRGLEASYDQSRKPGLHRIIASHLNKNQADDEIVGPYDHRLYVKDPLNLAPKRSIDDQRNLFSEGNIDIKSDESFIDRSICLDVYLYQPSTRRTSHLQLVRDATEESFKCLKRLGISVEKKIKSAEGGKKKKQKGGNKNDQASSLSASAFVSSQDRNSMECWSESGETTQNWQLWSRSLEDALVIEISNITSSIIPLQVVCNPPSIVGVRAFDNFDSRIFPGVPVPVLVDIAFADRVVIDWYADGVMVCKDACTYVPTTDDVGKTISVMITPIRDGHDGQGYQEAFQFSRPVESEIPKNTLLEIRPEWVTPRNDEESIADSKPLRVISYNILADQNAFSGEGRSSFYPYVETDILEKARRLPLVLHELLEYDADVLCLQEVDESVYYTLLEPVLTRAPYNYQGFFSCKTSGGREGTAMFWSLDRFEKLDSSSYRTCRIGDLVRPFTESLEDIDPTWRDVVTPVYDLLKERDDVAQILLDRVGHVAQIASLISKDPSEGNVLVANTHLFFHPRAQHIRLLQCFSICYEIAQMQRNEGLEIPFLFCGDFNSSFPYCGSLLTKAFLTGTQQHRHLNTFRWDKDGRSEITEERENPTQFPDLKFPDSFSKISSAYPEDTEFTHYIEGFDAALDYVTFTSSAFELACPSAPIPTKEQVTEHIAMPSAHFPSDHVSLVCDLKWKK